MPLPRRSALFVHATGAAVLAAAALVPLPAAAAEPAPRKVAAKPALKTAPATPRQQTRNAAKGLALATEVTEAISAAQLDVAARVHTGSADCEFKQTVSVQPVHGLAGYFHVSHQGRRYRMLPRETSTGAVRLEDPARGVVWLQIPTKSMLMDARRGQRMVDSCLHAEQRATVAAAGATGQGVGQGIGIVPQAPVVAQAAVVPVAAVLAPTAAAEPAPAASTTNEAASSAAASGAPAAAGAGAAVPDTAASR